MLPPVFREPLAQPCCREIKEPVSRVTFWVWETYAVLNRGDRRRAERRRESMRAFFKLEVQIRQIRSWDYRRSILQGLERPACSYDFVYRSLTLTKSLRTEGQGNLSIWKPPWWHVAGNDRILLGPCDFFNYTSWRKQPFFLCLESAGISGALKQILPIWFSPVHCLMLGISPSEFTSSSLRPDSLL